MNLDGSKYRLWFRYKELDGIWQFRDMELPNLSEVRRVVRNVKGSFRHLSLQMGLEKITKIWSHGGSEA